MNNPPTFQLVKNIPARRSIRIKEYDYSKEGMYFVTICVKDKQCLLGRVVDEEMQLNFLGKYAEQCWKDMPKYYPHVETDLFVIMPNHIHGIISIVTQPPKKTMSSNQNLVCPKNSLGNIVRGFKAGVTKWARENAKIQDLWQKNYYEHVIRNDRDYERIAQYVENNPIQWDLDTLNPDCRKRKKERDYYG